MKQALIYWFSFLAILLAITSCKSAIPKQLIVEKTKEVKVTETVRDTVIVTEKDSSYYQAYIDCVEGKPVLKNPSSKPGKKLPVPNVDLKGNQLTIDCTKDAEKLFIQWKEKFISELSTEQIPVVVPAELTDWQIIQIWCGRLLLLLFLVPIIYFIFKLIKR